MPFKLPELPFAYDALSPHMSAKTLEFHHDKHHNAYVVNGNNIINELPNMGETLEEIIINAHKQNKTALFNNAGQHWNHTFFWNSLSPNGGNLAAQISLETAISDTFGSVDKFRAEFIATGISQFGSGWVWLVLNGDGKLEITKTANAESPLIHGQKALLVCDVWEHSYYIDYRNLRPKYLEVFIDSLANWEFAASNYSQAMEKIAA